MENPKDDTMSKEWDEIFSTPESIEWLEQSKEELMKKIQNGDFLPIDAPDTDL